MSFRVKTLVCLVVAGATASLYSTAGHANRDWTHFFVYLVAILLCSGMKVALPKTDGTMSVNFPFILLGVLQLSPLQAVILAVSSVIAQCQFKVIKPFTLVQILFNVANVTTATVLACYAYVGCLKLVGGEIAPALAIASTVYFMANSAPVTLIVAWESATSPVAKWRQEFLWYLPFYLVGAMLAAVANLIGAMYGWLTSLLLIPLIYIVYRSYREQVAITRDRERHLQETQALHFRTIEALAMAVEAKDANTHQHLMRVRVYVTELGKAMNLDAPLMQALTTASYLHDIGKLAVPERIINKPGKLTPEEFEKMKIHPVVGAEILERVNFPYPVVPIVRSHHEAWDGSGYPDGLKGEEIPIGARLLTAVDCFDALASDRPYRKAMSIDQAMAFVKSKAGIQFDPQIVHMLEERYLELEELARKHIEDLGPLQTDIFIERGAAPGAGFVSENSAAQNPAGQSSAQAQLDPLSLIAEATREARALFELGRLLGASLSPPALCEMLFERLQPLVPCDCFAVYLKRGDSLTALYQGGLLAQAFSVHPIPVGEGLSGWVADSERPIINGNPTVESNFERGSHSITENSSALSIPLFNLDGSAFAVLTLYSRLQAAFSRDQLRILQAVESNFALALENAFQCLAKANAARIGSHPQHSNLRLFFETVDAGVESSRSANTRFGVGVCSFNSPMAANHDALLHAVVQQLRLCSVRSVASLSGNECVFLFSAEAADTADKLTAVFEGGAKRAFTGVHLGAAASVNVGTALFPEDGETAEQLLGAANRRMYRRAQAQRNANSLPKTRPALEGALTS